MHVLQAAMLIRLPQFLLHFPINFQAVTNIRVKI